jgi:hypothetical protein
VRAFFDAAVVTAEADVAHTLASRALAHERARAGARDDGAVLAVETRGAKAGAVFGALALSRACIGAILGVATDTVVAAHADAFASQALRHAQTVAAAVVVAALHAAVAAAEALFAGTGSVVALSLARALVRAGNELAGIASVAGVGRLGALADAFNALAATGAIGLAELGRAVDATEALAACAVLEVN